MANATEPGPANCAGIARDRAVAETDVALALGVLRAMRLLAGGDVRLAEAERSLEAAFGSVVHAQHAARSVGCVVDGACSRERAP
jgi:hypothetical protein